MTVAIILIMEVSPKPVDCINSLYDSKICGLIVSINMKNALVTYCRPKLKRMTVATLLTLSTSLTLVSCSFIQKVKYHNPKKNAVKACAISRITIKLSCIQLYEKEYLNIWPKIAPTYT